MDKNQIKPIYVVCATDDNYAQHCGVMLCSLIQNHCSCESLEIFILNADLSDGNKKKLRSLACKNDITFHFVRVKSSDFNLFKVSLYVSHVAYYRLAIPQVLPKSIEKVIYLDCDLIIIDEIKMLWDSDVSGYALAAVKDHDIDKRHLSNFNIPEGKYFNSGVMVLNLTYWREHDIATKTITFLNEFKDRIVWWDQDALNAILFDQWKELDNQWNSFFHFTRKEYIDALSEIPKKHLEKVSIIHFTGARKPWLCFFNIDPRRKYYFKYLKKTPWNDFKNPDDNVIKIFILKFFPKSLIDYIVYYESRYARVG